MRAKYTHGFQIRAFYDHFEEEVVIKRSGARYTATRIVIKLELYGDDVDLVSNLVDEAGLDFLPSSLPYPVITLTDMALNFFLLIVMLYR